ncbi:FadR/GntR family transcriptional regulator [Fervidibacillus albus]|uniref:FadR family transcriptional regulator n=1 Tax=Fervidibacillus albus TaxID=2980026 RepID=A0A9E8LUF7_9BACI|nr:FadR/GntR family transcriptional regulator [Fervidibacillus albus]WAA09009.1 FadR family transcriptional regulator [Fervidibacillus albus]
MSKMFNLERKGVSEKVADNIKELIQQGKYTEGQKIPGEREMAQKLNVSRNTVREAYKILEACGFVTIKHGNGVYVASEEEQIRKMTSAFFTSTDQIKDLFAVRKVLENSSVEWAIKYGKKEEIEKLVQIVEQSKKSTNDYQKLSDLDLEFHLSLANMSRNSVLIRIMHHLIDLLEGSRLQSINIPGRPVQSIKEHEMIVEAIKRGNVVDAQNCMSFHLDSVKKSIMEELTMEDGNE